MRSLLQFLIVCFGVFEIHIGAALAAQWTEANAGLAPGSNPGIRMLAIDHAGSTLYAVTGAQSVVSSGDGGSNWRALGRITGTFAIAVDPMSPSTVYAGTRHGVRTSRDGGENWSAAVLSENPVYALAVDPITPSTVYAAVADKLYKSTDGAATWTMLDLRYSSAAINTILLDPITPSTLYVVGNGSALYKSTDAGESWGVVDQGPFSSWLQIAPTNPSILYAIRFAGGFSRSTDSGATWTSIAHGLPVQTVATDPSNAATLYASTAGPNLTAQGIYRSTDTGDSWTLVNTTVPITISLTVDPADSSVIYAVSYNGGLFRSSDAGKTWSDNSSSLRVFDINVLSAGPAKPDTIYAGGSGGLFKSLDRGESWAPVAAFEVAAGVPLPGLPPPAGPLPSAGPAAIRSLLIDPTNPGTMYAGTHRTNGCFYTDKNFYKSTDGGVTWNDSISPEQSGCITDGTVIMDPMDSSRLYLPEGDDFDGYWLSKSTDAGATWTYTNLSADYNFSLAIDPRNSAILYAVTPVGVLRSSNGGGQWTATGITPGNSAQLAIDQNQPEVLYAVGSRGFFKSTDGGDKWSPAGKGLVDVLAVSFPTALLIDSAQSGVLYLATSGAGVFKSSDGGSTWAPFNDGLADLDVRVMALLRDGSVTLLAGTPGGIFKLVEDSSTARPMRKHR
jgi:photosystem II stability/assembly factor-like uncharacterized protein